MIFVSMEKVMAVWSCDVNKPSRHQPIFIIYDGFLLPGEVYSSYCCDSETRISRNRFQYECRNFSGFPFGVRKRYSSARMLWNHFKKYEVQEPLSFTTLSGEVQEPHSSATLIVRCNSLLALLQCSVMYNSLNASLTAKFGAPTS